MRQTANLAALTALCLAAGLSVPPAWGFNNDGQTDILWRNYSTGVGATPLVTGVPSFGGLRNDFSGWIGFSFQVGAAPLTATDLGRWVVSGNGGSHTVQLWNADGTVISGGSVTVNTAGQAPGQFAYATLPTAVTLAANTTYIVMSQETYGADQWYDVYGTYITLSSAASPVIGMWAPPLTGAVGGDGQSYGPVNLRYTASGGGNNSAWLMNGSTYVSSAALPVMTDTNWKMVGTGDFNNDGQLDILWRHATTGQNAVWYMNGTTYLSTGTIQTVSDTNWEIVGTGYFNADGKIDILWRNRVTGDNQIWLMNGIVLSSSVAIQAQPDLNWKIAGTGDFNNDGQTDIVWHNVTTGQNAVWYMNGSTYVSTGTITTVGDTTWEIVAAGYFDSNNQVDLLWRNAGLGQNVIWFMTGVFQSGSTYIQGQDVNWKVGGLGDSKLDTDADGLPDLWERNYFANLSQTASGDPDGDGLTNLQEYQMGTNPAVFTDDDADGLADGWEIQYFGNITSQNGNGDPDGDGLTNLQEYQRGYNPTQADTNGNGVPDGYEDYDGDGLANLMEGVFGLDPWSFDDADHDGIADWKDDSDGDGLPDAYERTVAGLNPVIVEGAPLLPSPLDICPIVP